MIANFDDAGEYRYYSYARYALFFGLKMAGIKKGSKVLLPSFICRDLLAVLYELGVSPCWYDISHNLVPLKDSIEWPLADAVLVVNYFGFPQDLAPFVEYRKRTGAILVEDNAHGYLSSDESGKFLGTRTEIGLFSYRKTLRMPAGSALWVSKKSEFIDSMPIQIESGKFLVFSIEIIKSYMRKLPFVGEYLYSSLISIIRKYRYWRTGFEIPIIDSAAEFKLPDAANPWRNLLSSLRIVDVNSEILRRRKLYSYYDEIASKIGAEPVFSTLPINCAPYGYAFRADDEVLNIMKHHANQRGFDFMSWPNLPEDVFANAPAYYRNVYMVNFLW